VAGAQFRHDQLIDEILGRHAAHVLVEAQRDQPIDPDRGQRPILLSPAGQARRRTLRVHEFLGTGLEDQHRGGRPVFGRTSLERPNHRLVPQVNTIVVADGKHAA